MPSRIDDLKVFVEILRHGSLSAAARTLRRTPNAVSRSLMRLEGEVGKPLCTRTTRTLSPTSEGLALHARAVRILEELDGLEKDLSEPDETPVGEVSIAIPPGLANGGLVERLGAFLLDHPRIAIRMHLSDDPVPATTRDLVVFVGRPPVSDLIAVRLGEVSWKLCATPGYLERMGVPAHPRDLAHHECLRFAGSLPQDSWTLVQDDQAVDVPVHGRFESDDTRVLGEATLAGLGIGIRSRTDLDAGIQAGTLVEVLPGWRFEGLPIVLLMSPTMQHAPRVRAVRAVLEAAVRERRD